MAAQKQFPWQDKINNHFALGGIETAIVDNGPAKGTRIAWINTGSGLRYKVVIDRAMDIADAFYNEKSLGWFSHAGITAPRPDANHGLEWLYSFGGGLMTTCGLTHIGQPNDDDVEPRGLHGRISNQPATLESVIQPDPFSGKLQMSITGTIKESRLFGTNLELRRTITSTLGEARITIQDKVTNRGSTPCPHMILYHCNFGYPMADKGARLIWKGVCKTRDLEMDNEIFNEQRDYKTCPGPLESHRTREACGFVDMQADSKGLCRAGLYNHKLNLLVAIHFKKKQLPWMSNWQHWGFGDYVTALEPGTNPPIGQNQARKDKKLIHIAPGRSKTYELEFEVLTDTKAIESFIKQADG